MLREFHKKIEGGSKLSQLKGRGDVFCDGGDEGGSGEWSGFCDGDGGDKSCL